MENAQSTARFTALGKYLIALANSFDKPSRTDVKLPREPSVKRKRLYLLYLINDLLYHANYHTRDPSICSKLQPALVSLFASAGSFKDCPKHQKKISNLLDWWEEKNLYSKDYIAKLREAVKTGSETGDFTQEGNENSGGVDQSSAAKLAKSAPFIMPAMHGDSSTPWYDLPAGNLMPAIEPNSTRPINPDMIRPMQFVAGPASEDLVEAVKSLLDDVKVIYGTELESEERRSWDVDELGQPIVLDEITGEVLEGEGYYGWSRGFCEKMKRRKKGLDKPTIRDDRDRSRSRSSTPVRKRRYSSASSSSEPRRSRRRRSYSSSRSPSPVARNGHSKPHSRNRSYSRSPRRSPSPRRRDPHPQEPPPLAPPINQAPPPPPPSSFQHGFNPAFPPQPTYNNAPPPPPNFNNAPPPPNFAGQWPPPPAPMHFNAQAPWPIPPPPPGNPSPQMNFQQGGYPPVNYPPAPPQHAQSGGPQGNYPPFPANGPGGWQGYGNQGDGRGWNGFGLRDGVS